MAILSKEKGYNADGYNKASNAPFKKNWGTDAILTKKKKGEA